MSGQGRTGKRLPWLEVFPWRDGQWGVRKRAGNGRIVWVAEGYSTKANAVRTARREADGMEIRVLDGVDR